MKAALLHKTIPAGEGLSFIFEASALPRVGDALVISGPDRKAYPDVYYVTHVVHGFHHDKPSDVMIDLETETEREKRLTREGR